MNHARLYLESSFRMVFFPMPEGGREPTAAANADFPPDPISRPVLGAAPRGPWRRGAQRTGIGVSAATGTAVTLFIGLPSMSRSE